MSSNNSNTMLSSEKSTTISNNKFSGKDPWEMIFCNLEEINWFMSCVNSSSHNITDVDIHYCDDGLRRLLQSVATLLTFVGLISNLTTIVTLISNRSMLPDIGRFLLIHQAGVDAFVCLLGILMYSQSFMWMTGNSIVDLFLCQAWHGQALYWTAVFVSVWNVILFAVERFIKINYPFYYTRLLTRDIVKALAPIYISAVIFLLPAYLQVRYDDFCGKCFNEYYVEAIEFEHFMKFYGVFWFSIVYAIPIGILATLYTKIILNLRSTKQKVEKALLEPINGAPENENANTREMRFSVSNNQARERKIQNAEEQITKTAVAVSVVFIFSLGWDAFYCLLGFTGAIEYQFNKPLQVTGVFLTALASCTTPFIYVYTMPIFRQSLKRTVRCGNTW